MGVYLLIDSHSFINLSRSAQIILGIVLVLYGIYRVFRVIKRLKNKRLKHWDIEDEKIED